MIDEDFILELENFIPKDICKNIIQKYHEDSRKERAMISQYDKCIIDLDRKNAHEIPINNYREWSEIVNYMNSKVKDAISIYMKKVCNYFKKYNENPEFINYILFNDKKIEPGDFLIQSVTPNSEYRWHTDNGPGVYQTCIIYLNDVDEKDGGATEFVCGKKIQPRVGKLILFPATPFNVHRGCFVTKPKYMITCQSMISSTFEIKYPFIVKNDVIIQKEALFR
jgi:hypothetical protein|tara:strand:- start:2 stop:673 length:672 start_codon:yes stop_codon:yes gene_type:complete